MALSTLALAASCNKEKSPCEDKLVVLEGDGVVQVITQWDACVARNASKIAGNKLPDNRLAQMAIELCASYADRYAGAVQRQRPMLSQDQVRSTVDAYKSNLSSLAISELNRARSLGCEAK
jgi:hypothetical protein